MLLNYLLGFFHSLKPVQKEENVPKGPANETISWFYHACTGDVIHMILRTRLPLFSRVVEKMGEPGDEARRYNDNGYNDNFYQVLCLEGFQNFCTKWKGRHTSSRKSSLRDYYQRFNR